METLKLEKVGQSYQAIILPWMFAWYHGNNIPTFERLKERIEGHFIPDQIFQQVVDILEQMSRTGYQTGRLIAPVKCEHITSDVKKVGDNLCLTHPEYSYTRPKFTGLVGVITEYTETFNAGGGRVTAGVYDNEYYQIIEIGEPMWITYL